MINSSVSQSTIEEIDKISVSNSACVLIYNEVGSVVYESPSLGSLCNLDEDYVIENDIINIKKEPLKFIEILKEENNLSLELDSSLLNNSMLLYAKKINAYLMNYYLAINTPLEPVESYITFFLKQYTYLAAIVIFMSLVISYLLSRAITNPIILMKKEADKLAEGDYNIDFKKKDTFTELNDLASTLDDATNKLGKIDELRKDLLANVSHDIKTPLTMIKAYAEMIRDISGENKEKREEHVNVILKEVDYLNKLVTDMQELSKMQAGIITLNRDNFELDEVIIDVIELLNHLLEERKVEVITNLTRVTVYGDEIKISQVIYNFISNAIKHSSENSKIEIRIIDSEEKVRVEVKDYGEGIKEELVPYIWDRYYKVDKNFARTQGSTGLGLAIAKAILEAHKAIYGVISKENEGSLFYFELSKDYEEENENEGLS